MHAQYFTSKKSEEGIEILENGRKVLFYQASPKTVDGKYERAGYVHPLFGLDEKILTVDMPEDHPYHRGIFWAWHQVILNGKSIGDGWISENISYTPVKADVKENSKCSILQSEMIWNARLGNTTITPIVREKTKITVFSATPRYRIVDFDINLFALRDSLQLGGSDDQKGYGGFCLRIKQPDDMSFISDNKNIEPMETAVNAGPWMDFTGSFDGVSSPKSGIAVFGYPPGKPEYPWILRKEASMQNIPVPGRTPFTLSKKGRNFKYRIIIHSRDLTNEEIETLYREYVK